MPTGVAIRDVRAHLFAAAERVLLREGPHALTSRAVTAEAGCAKGVLHKHFADFDDFLAQLVEDRIARMGPQDVALRSAAGTGTVTGNLTSVLCDLFSSAAVAIVALLIFRDDLRARLRQRRPSGIPLLTDAVSMITSYLNLERDLGRVIVHADIGTLARTLVGSAHLLFADRTVPPPDAAAVRDMVAAVLAGAVRERRQPAAGPGRTNG